MNNYEAYLKETYKDRINPCKKDINDIISYLNKTFKLKEIKEYSSRYTRTLNRFKTNCIHSIKNETNQYTIEELDILVYEIESDESSKIYYRDSDYTKENPIYVMLETKTGYIDSNSSLLLKKLFIYEGISKFDIENNTHNLFFFLRMIDEFECEIKGVVPICHQDQSRF
jgi:hypothetical protein